MTQIAALFLPKGSIAQKLKPVEKIKETVKVSNQKLPALLKGRVDGNQKNNSKVCSRS